MRKFLLVVSIICSCPGFAQRTCATNEKTAEKIAADPAFALHHQEIMAYIRNPQNAQNRFNDAGSPSVVVTIPVVFHVLYKNATQNISDAQINSQLTILNNDFRKLNADFTAVVPAPFQSFGADMEIVFCKASLTPTGQATTGITRKSVPSSFSFEDDYFAATGEPVWDPTKYLIFWLGRFTDLGLLGGAYLPEIGGGVVEVFFIGYQFFGNTGTATAPFNKGRTATHEIGHYFGLDHIWGYGDCEPYPGTDFYDDGIADTPATAEPYFGCPSFPAFDADCSGADENGDMFMNYMDYVDDACMAMFTAGQKVVMQNTLSGPRASLLSSNGCASLGLNDVAAINAIAVYPNPVSQYFMITSPHTSIDMVEVYNANGQLVKTQKLVDLNNKIYLDEFASGVYYLRIYEQGKFLKSDKIVKK
jgi:hypothetical protein